MNIKSLKGRGEAMLNIAIIDDEIEAIELLESFLNRYCERRNLECNVSKFSNPVRFLGSFRPVYDIIFLDIDMPNMSGMDIARSIRKTDGEVALIFVTNIARYAIHGYEVDADDFVVKPVKYPGFEIKLDHVIKKHGTKDKPRVVVYEDGIMRYAPISEVRYVEVIKHNIIYHMTGGEYEKRGTLKNEAQLFEENGFAQCNKSCLVNLRYVLGIMGYNLHIAKTKGSSEYEQILISHPRKKEFVPILNRYLEEHL